MKNYIETIETFLNYDVENQKKLFQCFVENLSKNSVEIIIITFYFNITTFLKLGLIIYIVLLNPASGHKN